MGAAHISPSRLRTRIEQLGALGRDQGGGLTRLPFSAAHVDATRLAAQMMREAGLDVGVDDFGTLVGQRPGAEEAALLTGSHLDTVPEGGIFDGALGVAAAIEVAQALQEAGSELQHRLAVVAFADEEGHAFGLGSLSSRALVGDIPYARLAALRDQTGRSLQDYLIARPHGLPVARVPEQVAAYLELHIEQGPVLERIGRNVAAVESITGILRASVAIAGRAAHAGTTPMDARADALIGAADLVLAVRELAAGRQGRAVGTVGRATVQPGASNVIPGEVDLSIELRSPEDSVLDALRVAVEQRARDIGDRYGLRITVGPWDLSPPVWLDRHVRDAVLHAIRSCGHPPVSVPSWAGHDAGVLAQHVPAGMIFITSTGGLSHSPQEHTPWETVSTGAQVLLATLVSLDSTETAPRRLPLAYAAR